MGGVELCIRALEDPSHRLQLLATETLANLAKYRKARRIVRRNAGLPKLVELLKMVDGFSWEDIIGVKDDKLPLPIQVARGGAFALWSLSKT